MPSEPLAQQIAMEWGVQEKTIKPNTMHMVRVPPTYTLIDKSLLRARVCLVVI